MANIGSKIFSKVLSETDTENTFTCPPEYAHLLPNFEGNQQVDFPVKDPNGRRFSFRCSMTRNGYPTHVISTGWKSFVDSKGGLKPGDQVIFYKDVGPDDARFVVSVSRISLRLFGKNVYGDEE